MRVLPLMVVTGAIIANTMAACAQAPAPSRGGAAADPAVVRERERRIAAFDSVVRAVNTDSVYGLWQAMLTTADIRATQALVQCATLRLGYRYGRAAFVANQRMLDTLWRRADPALVRRMNDRMAGEGPPISSAVCGPMPPPRAPVWLRRWTVPELPALPPSPDSTTADP